MKGQGQPQATHPVRCTTLQVFVRGTEPEALTRALNEFKRKVRKDASIKDQVQRDKTPSPSERRRNKLSRARLRRIKAQNRTKQAVRTTQKHHTRRTPDNHSKGQPPGELPALDHSCNIV